MLVYILNALWAENFRFEILLIAYNVLLQKLQRKNYFDISIWFKNKLMLDEWYDEWKHDEIERTIFFKYQFARTYLIGENACTCFI